MEHVTNSKGAMRPVRQHAYLGANPGVIGKHRIDLRDNDAKFFVKERVERVSKSPNAKG